VRAISFMESGNIDNCPFCNSHTVKTDEEAVGEMMKRVEVKRCLFDLCSRYFLLPWSVRVVTRSE
jgi:hypothetical protein